MNFLIGLAIAVLVVLVILGGSLLWVTSAITRETVTELSPLNPGGTAGQALVIYQPGMSDFPERVVLAFAQGLAEKDWAIDKTTASSKAPVNARGYDLVVLGSPIYAGAMARPLANYIARVADFAGVPVAIVLAGAGDTAVALAAAEAAVSAAGGQVIGSYAYTSMKPNEPPKSYPGNNLEVAYAMAHDDALGLDVPRTR